MCKFELFAYCLMGNHIHLLLKEGAESLEQIFKRLCGRFVYWYNIKYQRVGHLFQDRFKSEPVDSEKYFLAVLRYIHQNPVKAGMCKRVEGYSYSSYLEYIKDGKLVDTDYAFTLVSVEDFIALNHQLADIPCLDISERRIARVTDEQAKSLIKKISKCDTVSSFQSLDSVARNKFLKMLKAEGLSIRQLSKLTGVASAL